MFRIGIKQFRYMLRIAATSLAIADRTVRSPVDEDADLAIVKPGRHGHFLK